MISKQLCNCAFLHKYASDLYCKFDGDIVEAAKVLSKTYGESVDDFIDYINYCIDMAREELDMYADEYVL